MGVCFGACIATGGAVGALQWQWAVGQALQWIWGTSCACGSAEPAAVGWGRTPWLAGLLSIVVTRWGWPLACHSLVSSP